MWRALVPAAFARSAIVMFASCRAASSRWDRSVIGKPILGTDTSLVKGQADKSVLPSVSVAPSRTTYRIMQLRERAGLSRNELAEATGRSPKMIERYENGRVQPPADVLLKMASRLGATIDELLNVPPRLPSEMRIDGRVYVASSAPNGASASDVSVALPALGPAAQPARKQLRRSQPPPRADRPSPEE